MSKNKYKGKNVAKPIENHETAAWANIEGTMPVSEVMQPDELQVENAKDYVDENEK